MLDGGGPCAGGSAEAEVHQRPAAGVLAEKQEVEGHEGNRQELLHFDAAGGTISSFRSNHVDVIL